jgi:molecular chaperone HscB
MSAAEHIPTDPFSTLGLPARFDLSPAQIERAYLTRIASAHPDRGGGAQRPAGVQGRNPPSRESGSAAEAGALNRARRTLLNDEARARALLALLDPAGGGDDRALPPGLLMEIMEIRERVQADLQADAAAARRTWGEWVAARRAEHRERVAGLFAARPPAPGEIRRELNAWRYVERLGEQLSPDYDPAREVQE